MAATDDLVELPNYRPAPTYQPRKKRAATPKKRATLLDRLVAQAGVDRVEIDLVALEAELDSLRPE